MIFFKYCALILFNLFTLINSHTYEIYDIPKIFEILHHSCFVGFNVAELKTYGSIKDLSNIYQDDNVTVGLFNVSGFELWPNGQKVDQNMFMSSFVAIEKINLDRSCLLMPSHVFASPKPVPYKGIMSLNYLVEFINSLCSTFRQVDGTLDAKGKRKESILRDVYKVTGRTIEELYKKYPNSLNAHFVRADQMNNEMSQCEIYNKPPSAKEFFDKFLTKSKPVIFKGLANNWKALEDWKNNYIREKLSNQVVHIKLTPKGDFEGVESAKLWEDYESLEIPEKVRKQLEFPDLVVVRPAPANMKMKEFLDIIEYTGSLKNYTMRNISAYMEYSSISEYMPDMLNYIEEPEFIKEYLDKEHTNSWLSDGHTIGRLHFDPYDNLLCQVSGTKQVILFEPWDNENLYESHIIQGSLSFDRKVKKFRRKSRDDSTSMVMSPVDVKKPDFTKFPNFAKTRPLNCTISRGDVLYMPSFWWHEVNSMPNITEKRNLAVNFW
ncbi:DgyrCDS14347 [Dimorphilus gyrociliatus]|uniref:DgyrCDS14347 n=1 Tax=Dimorphilus gyrociliatus TaxID=2664684 RepID=A0A7I8WDM9_9ANNE|nr:DgyrCDS14347 [Dimorphilus gyrociliatus]